MGMTDSQFKSYLRLLYRDIKKAKKFVQEEKGEQAVELLSEILTDIQKSLED